MKYRSLLCTTLIFSTLLLSSCNLVQKELKFYVATVKGGDGYPLLSYADQKYCSFLSSSECYDSFFSNKYKIIIFDLAKGLDLIQNKGARFRLLRVSGYGNAYVVKRGEKTTDNISSFDNIISYDYAYSKYKNHTYLERGIQNNLFFCVNSKEESAIDKYYDEPRQTYEAFINGEGDYAILCEPYVSRLLEDENYSLFQNLVTSFNSKYSEWSHVPQTGIFIAEDFDNTSDDELKGQRENFIESIDKNLNDLSRSNGIYTCDFARNYVRNNSLDFEDYFGCSFDQMFLYLDGTSNKNGINAFGFNSYPVDLEKFSLYDSNSTLNVFLPDIKSFVYSKYYNSVQK